MMMKRNFPLLILLILTAFLAACGPGRGAPAAVEEGSPVVENGRPAAPTTPLPEGYPAPAESTTGYPAPQTLAIPLAELPPYAPPAVTAPDNGTGKIVGRLVDTRTNIPPAQIKVYVGMKEGLDGRDGEFVVTMQEQSSPFGVTDANGYFVIENLPPDSYGIIVFSPLATKLLADESTGDALFVNVASGQVSDVGDLRFTLP